MWLSGRNDSATSSPCTGTMSRAAMTFFGPAILSMANVSICTPKATTALTTIERNVLGQHVEDAGADGVQSEPAQVRAVRQPVGDE